MRYLVHRDVRVPTRDGITLAATLWRPDAPRPPPRFCSYGCPTAGNSNAVVNGNGLTANPVDVLRAGYSLVALDCRGTFDSDGTFVPHVSEADDGADTSHG